MRKITINIFVLNLVFINLSLLIMMPVSITANLWNKSTHGWVLCKFMVFIPNVSFIAHALTLFLMCMEHAFGDVMSKARGYRKHRIIAASITCLCVWIVACLLSLPPLLYLRYSTVQLPTGGELRVCVDYWPNSVSRAAYTSMKLLLLILTIIGCVLMKMAMSGVFGGVGTTGRIRVDRGLTSLILAVNIMFVICFTPHVLLGLIVDVWTSLTAYHIDLILPLFIVFDVLSGMNAMLQPVIYPLANVTFRKIYLMAVKCEQESEIENLFPTEVDEPDNEKEKNVMTFPYTVQVTS